MNAGRIEQIGTPQQVYDQPATSFVASFLGKANVIAATVAAIDEGVATLSMAGNERIRVAAPAQLKAGDSVKLVIRPQRLRLSPEKRQQPRPTRSRAA